MNKLLAFFKHYVSEDGYAIVEPTAAGLSLGIFGGLSIAAYSFLCSYTGYGIEIETYFEALLPGYSLTLSGAIVGVVWVFSIGYLTGSILAWIYNKLAKNS
jgi:hypothetical protein